MEQAKREVVEFVDFLKSPGKYEKLGARIAGGLLRRDFILVRHLC